MDLLADLLTASRAVIVLFILYVGITRGEDRLLLIVALTALAWMGRLPGKLKTPPDWVALT